MIAEERELGRHLRLLQFGNQPTSGPGGRYTVKLYFAWRFLFPPSTGINVFYCTMQVELWTKGCLQQISFLFSRTWWCKEGACK